MQKQTLYVSGPMSGKKYLNFPLFFEISDKLRKMGYNVINPAELTFTNNYETCIYFDLELIKLLNVDGIVLLPDSKKSIGSRMEVCVGQRKSSPIPCYSYNFYNNTLKLIKQEPYYTPYDETKIDNLYESFKKSAKNINAIGITGKMHTGKDTLADMILSSDICDMNNTIYIQKSFAHPIKKIMTEIFGFTEESVYDQNAKEVVDSFWDITPRKLMQLIGTDMFREQFRDDVWIKLAEFEINNNHNVIFSDVRFDNEAEMIHKHEGINVHIVRDEENQENKFQHKSEGGINPNLIDIVIYNNGTIEDLQFKANILSIMIINGFKPNNIFKLRG